MGSVYISEIHIHVYMYTLSQKSGSRGAPPCSGVQSVFVGGFGTRTLPTSQKCVMAISIINQFPLRKKNFGLPNLVKRKMSIIPHYRENTTFLKLPFLEEECRSVNFRPNATYTVLVKSFAHLNGNFSSLPGGDR